jgi:integration host factor subunit alpha
LEFILEYFKKTLESGEDILISGFGKFCVKNKNERRGRYSQTTNDLPPYDRRVVTFKCSPVLKKKLNEGRKSSPKCSKPTYPYH